MCGGGGGGTREGDWLWSENGDQYWMGGGLPKILQRGEGNQLIEALDKSHVFKYNCHCFI